MSWFFEEEEDYLATALADRGVNDDLDEATVGQDDQLCYTFRWLSHWGYYDHRFMLRDLDGNLLFSAAMEYYEYYDDEGNFDSTQGLSGDGYGDPDCGDDATWTQVGENDIYEYWWSALICEYELCVDEPGCYVAHTYWGEYPRGESWSLNGEYCNGAKFPYGYTSYPYISWPDEYMYYYEYENSYQYIALGDDVDRSCQTCCDQHYYEYYFMYDSESEFIGFFPNLVDYYLEEELVEDEDVEWVSVIDGECTDNLCFEDVSGDDCDWYDNFINDWCDEYGLCQEVYEVEEEEEEEDETLRGDDVVCSGGFCTWTITVEDICKWGEDEETPCNFVQCNGLPLQRTIIALAKDNCCACIEFEPFQPWLEPADTISTPEAVTEKLEEVEFFVANTIGGSDSEVSAAVGQVQTPVDEVIQAEAGMEFAVVWKTYQTDVEMDVEITFHPLPGAEVVTGDAAFLTMISNAENIEAVDDPGLRVFMNSFKVADDLEDEDAEAYIEYTFSGGIDYQYVIKFEYGAPGGDNVFMIDPPPSPDGDDDDEDGYIASSSTEGFFGQRTQSIIYITVGIVALVALVYFFLL